MDRDHEARVADQLAELTRHGTVDAACVACDPGSVVGCAVLVKVNLTWTLLWMGAIKCASMEQPVEAMDAIASVTGLLPPSTRLHVVVERQFVHPGSIRSEAFIIGFLRAKLAPASLKTVNGQMRLKVPTLCITSAGSQAIRRIPSIPKGLTKSQRRTQVKHLAQQLFDVICANPSHCLDPSSAAEWASHSDRKHDAIDAFLVAVRGCPFTENTATLPSITTSLKRKR